MSVRLPLRRQAAVGSTITNAEKRLDLILLSVGLAIVQFLPTHLEGDGLARYEVVDAIGHGQSLAGARYPVWGVLGSLPLYGIGRAIGHPQLLTAHYNGVLLAVGVVGLWAALRGVVDPRILRCFLLLVVAASMFAAHTEEFYGEMFSAIATGIGLVLVVTRPGWKPWALVVIGVANIPAAAPALVLVVGWRMLRDKRLSPVLAVAVAAALIVLDASLRHQSLLFGSYATDHGERTILPYSGRPGFSYPLALGVLALLFSFGKGLVFFVPAVCITLSSGVRRRLSRAANEIMATWVIFVVGLLFVYGRWWAWDGGFFWGPRFFLVACLPASLALAAVASMVPRRTVPITATLGLLVGAVYVGVNGAVLQSRRTFLFCQSHAITLPSLCSDVPEFGPLWRPVLDTLHPTVAQWCFAGWAAVVLVRLATRPAIALLESIRSRPRTENSDVGWRW
ncbi:MAG: hypothetical protein NVS3B21_14420 [Acidimicrobiales bacterium]